MKPRGRWRPMTPTPRAGCIPRRISRRVAGRRSALPCDNSIQTCDRTSIRRAGSWLKVTRRGAARQMDYGRASLRCREARLLAGALALPRFDPGRGAGAEVARNGNVERIADARELRA